jgi:leucine-rich repeat protein SHOC2
MLPEEIERIIELAAQRSLSYLRISNANVRVPDIIGTASSLTELVLCGNGIDRLPESIGNLTDLTHLDLSDNNLVDLPDTICKLVNLIKLDIDTNYFHKLPPAIFELANLTWLSLDNLDLVDLSEDIGKLTNLQLLSLRGNQISTLPAAFINLTDLSWLVLSSNPIVDLSVLQSLPNLDRVDLFDVNLPRKYWTKFSEWQVEWLIDETDGKLQRILIDRFGYERIDRELAPIAIELDRWRELTLIKFDLDRGVRPISILKIDCPSAQQPIFLPLLDTEIATISEVRQLERLSFHVNDPGACHLCDEYKYSRRVE